MMGFEREWIIPTESGGEIKIRKTRGGSVSISCGSAEPETVTLNVLRDVLDEIDRMTRDSS